MTASNSSLKSRVGPAEHEAAPVICEAMNIDLNRNGELWVSSMNVYALTGISKTE